MGDSHDTKYVQSSIASVKKPDATATSTPAPAHVDRVTPVPPMFDVGEQVFGSSHVFSIPAPWNLGPGAARVSVLLGENEAFSLVSAPESLPESGARMSAGDLQDQIDAAVKIRFAPAASGEFPRRDFSSELAIVLHWPDGTERRQSIHVRGRGRALDDRPKQTEGAKDVPIHSMDASLPVKPFAVDEVHRNELALAFNNAHTQAGAVARAQQNAIEAVHDEVGLYVPPPVKHSIWWDLAEGAIVLGTGVIAGMVSKWLTQNLATELSNALSTAGGPAANEAVSVASDAASGAVNRTGGARHVADALAGKMKDGMKSAAKTVMDAVHPTENDDVSSDKRIAFFEMQRGALSSLVTANEILVNERNAELTPLLGSAPSVAVRTMSAIGDALAEQTGPAKETQKHETAAAWVAFRARLSMGAEEVGAADHEEVTKLAAARPARPSPVMESIRGLLDLDIDVAHGAPFVERATANGVSKSLVTELVGINLKEQRMPLRFVVGRNEPEPTIITRDEAGRLRITGAFERLRGFVGDEPITNEAQAELAARRLVDEIMSRPLIPKSGFITDDVGKKTT